MRNVARALVFVSVIFSDVNGAEDPFKNESQSLSDKLPRVRSPSLSASAVARAEKRLRAEVESTSQTPHPRISDTVSADEGFVAEVNSTAGEAPSPVIWQGMETEIHPTHQLPLQKTCEGVRAELKSVAESITDEGGKWMLRRVTPMKDYEERFGRDRNFCGVFYFGPDCSVVHFIQLGLENYMTASNTRTKTTVITTSHSNSIDEHYAVFRDTVLKIEDYNEDNESISIKDLEPLRAEVESEYALVALASHRRWSIWQTCDKKVTWVKVFVPSIHPGELQANEILREYDAEIEGELSTRNMESEPTSLVFVPVYFSIHDIF